MSYLSTSEPVGCYRFGLEHEVAFWDQQTDQFADFSNTSFQRFDRLIAQLPEYASDYPQLRIGDAGIKRKRWYIEGYERFSETGNLIGCMPKGIEIRTTLQPTMTGAVQELRESFAQLSEVALPAGLLPVLTSFNPIHKRFVPEPPLNHFEAQRREASPEKQTAHIPMMTYGPDLNFSIQGLSTKALIQAGKKLTYYSPAIVPFSFSSPFYGQQLWSGLSVRTHLRTGRRPAAMVFVEHPEELISSSPSLTKIARLPAEVGRIEFKACDSCGDFELYGSLLALLKGIVLDQTLPGAALVPDAVMHQHAAIHGFQDPELRDQALRLLAAADRALSEADERERLQPLWQFAQQKTTPAQVMCDRWRSGVDLVNLLSQGYTTEYAAIKKNRLIPQA
ncbi:glutamate--cysteine ligase [Leptothoe spongobia]|uniref:Glutamate--cysteine ligase n=1 Tax=Leptothoe spongobia TAU-MAC 1115 TaxID=1967444 RepID=A0A947GGV4_9CYAN|nr:glutamate--cysteine ligase [Leptothoe spongobia]MBT9314574.1 glutamate--cysteine ligase [Leptothoe spongobia TAU-MAC 1115]